MRLLAVLGARAPVVILRAGIPARSTIPAVADQPARKPIAAGAAADRVGSILAAAEAAAERIRNEAERRLNERIAEAERAADHRVQAAEEEAAEIIGEAEAQAAATRSEAQAETASMRAEAATEALTIAGRAQENADAMLAEAREEAERVRYDAEERARALLRGARETAGEVRAEGMELVENLREMGNVLRSNAERLLRDVQAIHSRMVAELDQADAGLPPAPSGAGSRGTRSAPRSGSGGDLDVPEFIPPG